MVIEPAFTFQGGRFTDGLEITLLGARWYRPALGRFLTCDPTLLQDQDRIAPLGAAINLYVLRVLQSNQFHRSYGGNRAAAGRDHRRGHRRRDHSARLARR